MGLFRLLLAYLVVESHAGPLILGFNAGAVAVISFFLLSGYVMTALIDRHYSAPSRIGWFYLDRAARLYPQFLFYSLATLIAAEMGLRHPWMPAPPSPASAALQMAMLPLNFANLFDAVLIPQAWSLGLEGCFYLLFPIVLLAGRRGPCALASVLVFALAAFQLVPSSLWGYRLLPGVLFIFLLGSWLRRPDPGLGLAPAAAAAAISLVALVAGLTVWPAHNTILHVIAGLALGLPVVYALSRLKLSARLDALAGDLSYGVFLNHNLLLPMLSSLLPGASPWLTLALLLPLSTAASYASFRLIEQPVIGWRRALRARPAPERLQTAPA